MSDTKETNNTTEVCCKENDTKTSKVKILAIHGYRQNGETFRQKTGSFRKMVHKWAQFTYITAPHKVIPVEDLSKTDENDLKETPNVEEYGWFFNRDDKTFRGIRKGGPAIGFEETLTFIQEIFEKEGPFDGIVGFSQGGCLVGLLCDLQERGLLKFSFNFAIISSGFKSNSLPHSKYFGDPISIPSLHIYGTTDNIIPTDMSEALKDSFEDPVVVTHPGGHYFPASGPQKHTYQKFVKLMLLQKEHNLNVLDKNTEKLISATDS